MTKRCVVGLVLVCAVAFSMTGCKKKPRPGAAGSGVGGTDIVGPGTITTDDAALGERFPAGNAVAGQFEGVLFAFDSAQVDEMERGKIEQAAEYLRANPQANMILEGNCDERGSNEYNMSLGERRALAVRSYLMNLGVDSARLQTKSLGEERPKDAGHSEEAWRVNRRVDFVTVQP